MLNQTFLRTLHPINVAIKGIIFYLIVFFITPAYVTIELAFLPFIYILACYLAFFSGTFAFKIDSLATLKKYSLSPKQKKILLYAILAIAMFGVSMRLFERVFIRGIVPGADVFENRDSLDSSGTSMLAVISTLIFPVVYFNLFWVMYTKEKNKLILLISYVIFFYPAIDAYLVGSRSLGLQNVVVLTMMLAYFKKIRVNVKTVIVIIVALIVVVFFFVFILYNRLGGDKFQFDFSFIMENSAYNFTFGVKPWFIQSINDSANDIVKLVKFTGVQVGQYFAHGLFEFNYLYEHYNKEGLHDWGNNTLFLYYRVVELFGPKNPNPPMLFVREGLFTTFFGDVWVDFGWYGLIFMYFFGVFAKNVWVKIMKGNVFLISLYFILVYIIFLMPTANLLSGGFGLIVLNSLLIPYIIYKIVKIKVRKNESILKA